MNTIDNKRILFLCTGFFSYYKSIKEEMEKMGASVKFIEIPRFPESHRNIRHSKSYFFLYHYLRNPRYRTKWTNDLLDNIRNRRYDILFCIGDVPFKDYFLDEIKAMNPKIQTYLFLWDRFSIVYVPPRTIQKFDYKFSFDRDDCAKVEGLQYLPDFYIQKGKSIETPLKYDVCVIATCNENRLHTSSVLKDFCERNGLKPFIYLLSSEYSEKYDFVKKQRLTTDEVDKIQNQSRCIFDFSYKGRQGLTLNAIAALAKGKKLITSNVRIKDEAFYDPHNIYFYDFDKPQFDVEFFRSEARQLKMDNLRLDNWLKFILCR